MTETYGFGGSEPSREVPPGANAESVNSSEGESTAPVVQPLDGMFTDNIAGMSPVSGLMPGDPMCDSDWETTSLHPSSRENCSSPAGAATGSLGAWPIQNYGNDPRQHSNLGEGDVDWTGHVPGDEE